MADVLRLKKAKDQRYKSRFLDIDIEHGRFRVSREAFTDPEIFAEEQQKIFLNSWLVLGHESEIPNPNDFVVREVLDKTLIFSRSADGKVRALLNTCTHRGAAVCRERKGNRKTFTCGYHGWVFRNTGKLVDTVSEDGYPNTFNSDGAYDLFQVERIESRGGFYFINFNRNAETLDEFLAGAGEMLDLISEQSKSGLEIIQGCHEYSIKANYKLLCENSMDGFHLWSTHASYVEILAEQYQGQAVPSVGGGAGLGRGHGVLEMNVGAGRTVGQWIPAWGEEVRAEIEERKRQLIERLGPEKADRIANYNRMMVIFPNTVINDQHAVQLRAIYPLGPNEMQVRAWIFGPADESPLLRRIRIDNALSFLGPAGFGTPDDAENLEQAQDGYRMGGLEWNDISNGLASDETPGHGKGHGDGEVQMRSYWIEYDRIMESGQ